MRLPARRRIRLSDLAAVDIGHLLVVAGPSGAGKSAFLRALASGALGTEVAATLPKDAANWPQTSGTHISDEHVNRVGSDGELRLDGMVLHYDFMRIFESLIPDYASDPSLSLLAAARRITVVTLAPPDEVVVDQIEAKLASQSRIRQLERKVRRVVRRIVRPRHQFIYPRQTGPIRHERLASLYRSPGFLASWYRRWGSFVDANVDRRRLVARLIIKPFGGGGFCLVASADVSTRE